MTVVEVTRAPAAIAGHRRLQVLFTATSFLSAFLLFLVQPMVAKLVLPPYGGSASVWNTTNAFFQATLLAGYAYSHVLTGRLAPRRQGWVHGLLLLLPLLALPLGLPAWAEPPDGRSPALWLVLVLVVAIGAPFLAVSTTGPLLQRWFSYSDHPRAADPYFLYAAGNVGSFLALLAYPVVVEPRWDVGSQARGWAAGYVALIALVVACGRTVRAGATAAAIQPVADAAPRTVLAPTNRRRLRWLVFAAVPSSLMLGVTSYLTADLAAVPLLWVFPLSLYLATFVVAFGRPAHRPLGVARLVLLGSAVAAAVVVVADDAPLVPTIAIHLALFTAGAYVAHRRLALDRPGPEHLTGFYLVVALGGVLGGSWNAFVAPLVFDRVVEYPLAVTAAVALGVTGGSSWLARRYGVAGRLVELGAGFGAATALARLAGHGGATAVVVVSVAAAGIVAVTARMVPLLGLGAALLIVAQVLAPLPEPALLESRTFFGVYRVAPSEGIIELVSGSTIHGAQDPADPRTPLSYYTREGPAGQLMATYAGARAREVGLVGLGAGALATYGRPGQHLSVYEIDPEVVRIARDSGHFTYLRDSAASIDYHLGDGRLELADPATPSFDLLVLDAFSGDAIPVHLLTVEAFDLYLGRLADGGVVAVHISNRYLDLRPVVAGAAEALGATALVRRDPAGPGTDGSWWMAVARDPGTLADLATDPRWHPADEAGTSAWTDTRSNLLDVLGVEPP